MQSPSILPRALGAVALLTACGAGADSTWRVTHAAAPGGPSAPQAPDVLVVLVDALRPDHLGCYGYERDTSPFLDRWARGATRFERVYTHGTHTRIALASLFTGTLPTFHRIENVELAPDGRDGTAVTDGLADGLTTWAESFAARGYETWALSTNPHVSAELGFQQGFHLFLETTTRDAATVVDRFLELWAERRAAAEKRPLFAYLHFMDVHNPYDPPEGYRHLFGVPQGEVRYRNGPIDVSERDLAWTVAQYDGGIRYLDDQLARLLARWETPSRPKVTVVLSDHGDEFLEHGGMGHGTTVHEELARTALIVASPRLAPGVRAEPLAHVDVHRLVLDLAGAASPAEDGQGRPLDGLDEQPPSLLTRSRSGVAGLRLDGRLFVVGGEAGPEGRWYDCAQDPGELRPRWDPAEVAELRARYEGLVERDRGRADELGTPARMALRDGTAQDLRGLGYLGGDDGER